MIENKRYSMPYQMCKALEANFLTVLERIAIFGTDSPRTAHFNSGFVSANLENPGRVLEGVS